METQKQLPVHTISPYYNPAKGTGAVTPTWGHDQSSLMVRNPDLYAMVNDVPKDSWNYALAIAHQQGKDLPHYTHLMETQIGEYASVLRQRIQGEASTELERIRSSRDIDIQQMKSKAQALTEKEKFSSAKEIALIEARAHEREIALTAEIALKIEEAKSKRHFQVEEMRTKLQLAQTKIQSDANLGAQMIQSLAATVASNPGAGEFTAQIDGRVAKITIKR